MDINKINEQLEIILNEEQINEMSMAWNDDKHNVCAWVENPSGYNNKYFKYYDGFTYGKATKVARISLIKPIYLNHKDRLDTWVLTKKEKQILINILNQSSDDYDNCTKWQDLLITYNQDNFGIKSKQTIHSLFNIEKYPDAFLIDFPMPDYMKL